MPVGEHGRQQAHCPSRRCECSDGTRCQRHTRRAHRSGWRGPSRLSEAPQGFPLLLFIIMRGDHGACRASIILVRSSGRELDRYPPPRNGAPAASTGLATRPRIACSWRSRHGHPAPAGRRGAYRGAAGIVDQRPVPALSVAAPAAFPARAAAAGQALHARVARPRRNGARPDIPGILASARHGRSGLHGERMDHPCICEHPGIVSRAGSSCWPA